MNLNKLGYQCTYFQKIKLEIIFSRKGRIMWYTISNNRKRQTG